MLVQLLKKGHYQVQLTDEDWRRLYAWIDYNVPYPGNWRESHRPPSDDLVARRALFKQLYAAIDDRDEEQLALPPLAAFEPPPAEPEPPAPLTLSGWPLTAEQAQQLQTAAADAARGQPTEKALDLGDGVTMEFALVPAGKFVMGDAGGFADERPQAVVGIEHPFYMGRFEVTNAQYGRFDSEHNSGVIDERWKDRNRRGTPIDAPELPVVRDQLAPGHGLLPLAVRADGRSVQLAYRGPVGVGLPRRHGHAVFPPATTSPAWRHLPTSPTKRRGPGTTAGPKRATTTAFSSPPRAAASHPMPGACAICTGTWPSGAWRVPALPLQRRRRPRRSGEARREGGPRRFLERHPEAGHLGLPLALRVVQAGPQRRLPRGVHGQAPRRGGPGGPVRRPGVRSRIQDPTAPGEVNALVIAPESCGGQRAVYVDEVWGGDSWKGTWQ